MIYKFLSTGPTSPIWYPSVSESLLAIPPFTVNMSNFFEYNISYNEWWGPPFYSETGEHTLQLQVYAYANDGVYVAVYLMESKNGEMLKWPFSLQIAVQLLDWEEKRRHRHVIIDDCDQLYVKSTEERRQFGDAFFFAPYRLNARDIEYHHNYLLCFNVSVRGK